MASTQGSGFTPLETAESPDGGSVRRMTSYWSDPAKEAALLETTDSALAEFDLPNMLFYITTSRSHERDAVVYDYVPDASTMDGMIHPYFVLVEESSRAKVGGDVTRNLNELESMYYDVEVAKDGSGQVVARIRALDGKKDMPIRLVKDSDGQAVALVSHPETGEDLRLDRAYVQFARSAIIDVESVSVYATRCQEPFDEVRFVLRR